MSDKNKKILATFLSIVLFICVSLSGIIMARELYVNNTKCDLIFKDLEPQSTIRLDKPASDVSSTPDYCVPSNSHEMLTNTIEKPSIISIWANWDTYTPVTQLERYTAANMFDSNCGYDSNGNLKNAYLFPDIVSKEDGVYIGNTGSDDSKLTEALKQKVINYASTRVTGTVVLSAETPLGYNDNAYTINLSDTLLPAVIEIPRDSFSFPNDNAKWHLASSYRLTIEQGPNVYYYHKSSDPSASELKEFATNKIISDKNYTGVSIVVTGTGREYYYNGEEWVNNNLFEQKLKSNYISLKLRANSNTSGPGYELKFFINASIKLTSIKQTLLDTFDPDVNVVKLCSFNSITTTIQAETYETNLYQDLTKINFIGVLDNHNRLLDGIYVQEPSSDGTRTVYVNSGKDSFQWEAVKYITTVGGVRKYYINIRVKWIDRSDTSVLYPVTFYLISGQRK